MKQHYSDHYKVTTNRLTKQQVHTPRYTQTRPYNQIDYEILYQNIANDPLIRVILNYTNVDTIAQNIINLITYHLEQNSPLRTLQTKKKNAQPISAETKQLIIQRDSAWNQYIVSSSPEDLRDHRHLKIRVNKSLKNYKFMSQCQANLEAANSCDKWKNAKSQLGWIHHGGPKILIRAGQTITSPQRMADELNQNYIVSAAKTRQNIPKNCGDPLVNFKKLTEGKDLNLAFQPIRRHELYKIISSINPSKSSALDGLSMKFLNQIKEPLIEVLLHLVNSSIIQSKYPAPLKRTNVIPLLKKQKDPTSPDSYRGINLIPSVAKIIDKVILNQLSTHLEQNYLIPHHHHGGINNSN